MSRLKSDQEQLKSVLPGAPLRRFDPSKAFQHNKENRENEKNEPLREGEKTSQYGVVNLRKCVQIIE